MDLVGDPSILVCDEPTSGLDAAQSLAVMDCLVRIASGTGCAVIASLHQPRSEIFDKVDRILMLAGGGKVAYEGTRVDVLKSFETLGLSPPSDWTLADWLLDMVTRERQLLIEKHAFNYEKSNRLAPPQFEEKTASEKQDKVSSSIWKKSSKAFLMG